MLARPIYAKRECLFSGSAGAGDGRAAIADAHSDAFYRP